MKGQSHSKHYALCTLALCNLALCNLALCTLALCTLLSCRPHVLYHHYETVNPKGWSVTDTLCYALPPAPSERLYTLSLGVRFNQSLRYQDLYLVVEQRQPVPSRDTVHVHLANERGRWQARGVVLHDCETVVTATRLDTAQQNTFLIYHIMSPQEVPGITEVGLKVE